MSKIYEKQKAIILRKNGMSYAQIREKLGISKSTLSNWLSDIPLSSNQIKALGKNSKKIENYINTMRIKREYRLNIINKKAGNDIGTLKNRDLFIAGLFLYWGEGGKVNKSMLSFTNTNPDMIKYFIRWCSQCLKIDKDKLYVNLHLYSDMNTDETIRYWAKEISLNMNQFKKPYIKDSKLSGLTYKSGFGKGTCTIRLNSKEKMDYVLEGIKYLRTLV